MMDVVWGVLLAAAYFVTRRYGRGAWVLFAAVLSHWVLDWASHRPDMPLAPGFHRYYGLGLYNSPLGLLIVEGGLWVIGIILYLRATHTRGFVGHLVLWTFIVVFTALWLLSFNGEPPPSVHVLVTVDLILFDRVRLGILDRSFATAGRDIRARVTSKQKLTSQLPTIRESNK